MCAAFTEAAIHVRAAVRCEAGTAAAMIGCRRMSRFGLRQSRDLERSKTPSTLSENLLMLYTFTSPYPSDITYLTTRECKMCLTWGHSWSTSKIIQQRLWKGSWAKSAWSKPARMDEEYCHLCARVTEINRDQRCRKENLQHVKSGHCTAAA